MSDPQSVYGIVKSQGLNVRREPSRHGKIIDQLSRGDRVKIISTSQLDHDWIHVLAREGHDNAVRGFCFAPDVEIEPPPPLTSEEDTQIFTPQPPPFFQRNRTEAIVLGLVIAAVAALLIMVLS